MSITKNDTEVTTDELRRDWNCMHERVRKYATLIEALRAVEERTEKLFLRVHCSAMNPVVRYQARVAVSHVRTACQNANQPVKAFKNMVVHLYAALVSPVSLKLLRTTPPSALRESGPVFLEILKISVSGAAFLIQTFN
jgi:hypothetical protein